MSNPNPVSNLQGSGLTADEKAEVTLLYKTNPDMTIKKIAETLNLRHGQVAGYIVNQQRKGALPNRKPRLVRGMPVIGHNAVLANSLVQLRLQYSRAVDAKARIDTECRELKTAIMALEALTGDKGE